MKNNKFYVIVLNVLVNLGSKLIIVCTSLRLFNK